MSLNKRDEDYSDALEYIEDGMGECNTRSHSSNGCWYVRINDENYIGGKGQVVLAVTLVYGSEQGGIVTQIQEIKF